MKSASKKAMHRRLLACDTDFLARGAAFVFAAFTFARRTHLTELTDPLKDFAIRTIRNLKFIDNRAETEGLYEVTQLINSFLGLFVFAQQAQIKNPAKQIMPECIDLGRSSLTVADYPHLRNAIAHYHMEPINEGGKVCGLRLWDERDRTPTWGPNEYRVEELRTIVDAIHTSLTREQTM